MKIAVPFDDGFIAPHFGYASQFKLYTAEDGKVVSSELVSAEGAGHDARVGFLTQLGAGTVICGSIGREAFRALQAAGIRPYAGVMGRADGAVAALLDGVLGYNPRSTCEESGCGGCGSGSCGG